MAETETEAPKLLAGKYENAEALEKGYLELQSKYSAEAASEQVEADKPALDAAREMLKAYGAEGLSPEQSALVKKYGEAEKAADEKKDEDKPAEKKDDENKNHGTKPEHAGLPEGTDFSTFDFLVEKGFTADAVKKTMGKMRDGTFSDEDAKAIAEKIGVPEAVVKGYAAPRTAQKATDGKADPKADAAPQITEDQYKQVLDSVGGETEFKSIQEWARKSLTNEEAGAFNAAIDSGNHRIVMQAVKGLKAMRELANGSDPKRRLGLGSGPASLEGFESQREASVAMADPRYDTSEKYRNEVIAKIARSTY